MVHVDDEITAQFSSPLLAARSGLSTDGSSLSEVAAKVADTVRVKHHA